MTDFDGLAERYRDSVQDSIEFSGQSVEFFSRRKAERVLEITARLLTAPSEMSFLDVGCGVGMTDRFLSGRVGHLVGVDEARLALAAGAGANPSFNYCGGDALALPFPDGCFDVAFTICVLHHVHIEHRAAFLSEMTRVVRPGGLVLVFEHNPWNPGTRVAVSRCEFDVDVSLLARRTVSRLLQAAGLQPIEARDLIFTTSDRAWAGWIETVMAPTPFGAQHYVAARR
ncbi:MAG: class I SAM-dependent methyltransferase [Actinomycetes bacterium]